MSMFGINFLFSGHFMGVCLNVHRLGRLHIHQSQPGDKYLFAVIDNLVSFYAHKTMMDKVEVAVFCT